jgi:hypothetical protein
LTAIVASTGKRKRVDFNVELQRARAERATGPESADVDEDLLEATPRTEKAAVTEPADIASVAEDVIPAKRARVIPPKFHPRPPLHLLIGILSRPLFKRDAVALSAHVTAVYSLLRALEPLASVQVRLK